MWDLRDGRGWGMFLAGGLEFACFMWASGCCAWGCAVFFGVVR